MFLKPFLCKCNLFVQMLNTNPGRNLPVLNFGCQVKTRNRQVAHVNGKQPVFLVLGPGKPLLLTVIQDQLFSSFEENIMSVNKKMDSLYQLDPRICS